MVENVRKAFVSGFSKLKWMDAKTKKVAIEKADLIKQKIGYPKYILEPAKLDQKYEGVSTGVLRPLSNIYDEAFCKNRYWLKVNYYFSKSRCLIGSSISE